MTTPELSRRGLVAAVLASLATSGCAAGVRSPSSAGGRAVRHLFGTAHVPLHPRRIVALGIGDLEAAVALGMVPVAGTDLFGLDDRLRPWVAHAVAGTPDITLLDWQQVPFERIAALTPDLILYVNSPNDRSVYDLLAKIAPTLAAPVSSKHGFDVDWRDQLDLIARATGRQPQADSAAAHVDDLLAAARVSHPELAGLTITGGVVRPGQVFVWPPSDPRMRLFAELGLVPNTDLRGASEDGYLFAVSPERYDLIDTDVVYLDALDARGRVDPELYAGGTFARLDAVRAEHVVYAPGPSSYTSTTPDGDYASAFAVGGVLGIPACLDRLVADLARAAAGS